MASLEQLLQQNKIWQANQSVSLDFHCISSGYPQLDALFPGGGWPCGALTEILCDQPGIGELRLLLPMLVELSRQPRWQLWITPPWQPYAPALAQAGIVLKNLLLVESGSAQDCLWAFEQGLRSGTCSVVLGWLRQLRNSELRRLQLAAASGNSLGILFRSSQQASQPSPAALRLQLDSCQGEPELTILKRRGGWPVPRQRINLHTAF